jgi:tripartite-type tricarboxylate transporter receptor subunit TctC
MTGTLAGFVLAALPTAGMAQDYPDHTIEWIVPSSAGSGFDVVTRIITTKLPDVLGVPVVVQNIAGAGATIGAAKAADAEPDGYTVLITNVNHTANEALRKDKPYDLLKDFDPVIRFGVSHYVIVVNPTLEVDTLEDLIAMAKEKPGELTWASAGVGSSTFMLGAMFQSKADLDVTHIPYEGGGPAVAAAVAGEVNYYGAPYATAKPFIEEGTLKALAVTADERVPFLPDLPAASETVPGFAFTSWYGIEMPAGTPPDRIEKFRQAMIETLADPDVKKGLEDIGLELIQEGPEEFKAYLEKEVAEMNEVVKEAGIAPQ